MSDEQTVRGEGGAAAASPAPSRADVEALAAEREAARAKMVADAEAMNTPDPATIPMEPLNLPPTQPPTVPPTTAQEAAANVHPITPDATGVAGDAANIAAAQPFAPPVRPENVVDFTPVQGPADHTRKKTRAEIAAMREAERTESIDYYLPITKEWVRVRDLPFSDRVILMGIPAEMRDEVDASIKDETIRKVATQGVSALDSISEMAKMFEKAEALINGVCIAAFVRPRLVLHERDLEPGNEDIWLVTDVHVDERTMFFGWVQRNRAANNAAGGAATIAETFPGPGVGSPTDSAASNPVQQTTG